METKGFHDQVNVMGKIDIKLSLQAPVSPPGLFFFQSGGIIRTN